jgi:hypothetical protein
VNNKLFIATYILSTFVIQAFCKELWQSYKFEMNMFVNNSSQISEDADSSFYLLITGDSIKTFEEHHGCFLNSSHIIDSIKNDSIYSPTFLSTNQSVSIIYNKFLYYVGNELIYYESEEIIDEGSKNTAKIYFNKIDTLTANELNANVCTTISKNTRKSIKRNNLYSTKKKTAYNLLEQ